VQGANFEYVAAPSRSVRGVVRDKATGKPIAGVQVSVDQGKGTTLTDARGRFEVHGCPRGAGAYNVRAEPRGDQPYFAAATSLPAAAGGDTLTVHFELTRGARLHGRVTDAATRKPPRAAVVEYCPLANNPNASELAMFCTMAASSAAVGADGAFSLTVLPGPGVVCVAASPRQAYAAASIEDIPEGKLHQSRRITGPAGGLATAVGGGQEGLLDLGKYHAISLLQLDAANAEAALELTLQPAQTLSGVVVGPDGELLTGVEVAGLTPRSEEELLEEASFTVTGLGLRLGRELIFHHRGRVLGTVLRLRGDEGEPLVVRLDACGVVHGRIVNQRGKPLQGAPLFFYRGNQSLELYTKTDPQGRFRVELLPDDPCLLEVWDRRRYWTAFRELRVATGVTRDLGDTTVPDPPR
jgi:hypothetical protein